MAPRDQWITTTASRRTGPRRWIRAVEWHIAAGHHPKANATTLQLAEDLAARMDYDTGHVRYCLEDTAARLGVDVSTVKRHAKYLREAGLLAWVAVGSRTNIRRALGLPGYAATATVYAAVIPAVVDQAMGRTVIGSGYEARIVVDQRGRDTSPKGASKGAVDNSPEGSCAPPSLTVVKESGSLQVESGFTTTAVRSQKIPSPTTTTAKTASKGKRRTILGRTITAHGIQLGDRLARAIRRCVPWTRKASHDQLRWVCADMAEQQWTEHQVLAFVSEVAATNRYAGLLWQPERPHALLAAGLRAHHQEQQENQQRAAQQVQQPAETIDGATWLALVTGGKLAPEEPAERTDDDRRAARLYGWDDWSEIASHYAADADDALDLYGTRLCMYAVRKAAEANQRQEIYA